MLQNSSKCWVIKLSLSIYGSISKHLINLWHKKYMRNDRKRSSKIGLHWIEHRHIHIYIHTNRHIITVTQSTVACEGCLYFDMEAMVSQTLCSCRKYLTHISHTNTYKLDFQEKNEMHTPRKQELIRLSLQLRFTLPQTSSSVNRSPMVMSSSRSLQQTQQWHQTLNQFIHSHCTCRRVYIRSLLRQNTQTRSLWRPPGPYHLISLQRRWETSWNSSVPNSRPSSHHNTTPDILGLTKKYAEGEVINHNFRGQPTKGPHLTKPSCPLDLLCRWIRPCSGRSYWTPKAKFGQQVSVGMDRYML